MKKHLSMFTACLFLWLFVPMIAAQDEELPPWQNPILISSVQWNANTGHIALLVQGEGPILVDPADFSQREVERPETLGSYWDAAFSPDGSRLAAINSEKSLTVWDTQTGGIVYHDLNILVFPGDVDWSADGAYLVVGGAGVPGIRVYETAQFEPVLSLPRGEGLDFVALSRTNRLGVATAAGIQIWNIDSDERELQAFVERRLQWSIEWSADETRLLTSALDLPRELGTSSVQILDAATGAVLREFGGFPSAIRSAHWSPDERWALTSTVSGMVYLIDTEDGSVRVLLESDAPVLSAAWSPDVRQVAVGVALGASSQPGEGVIALTEGRVAGLEVLDIAASRCIAIPMRRTDKKMPSFPPDFDGAAVRHQLYMLALTAFPHLYTNYFERPALHTLHNRSSELWSPLVALAAFFEEQGSVTGLFEAIAAAAENDEQISQGKALSEREEAVLQALELLTRGQDGTVWIKAATLREKVARLIGQPVEKMGDTQWIGHILKRLHLLDEAGRKRGMDGITYAVKSSDVIDMMRRYDVAVVHESR
jgi:dipeptidyl aminopeptidase/acylaminoacyl peptidase